MEWHQVTERTGYFYTDFVSIPVYHLTEDQIVLIDSGYYESEALVTAIKENGLAVRAVLNTHLHIDHVFANPELQKLFGCSIFADRREQPYVEAIREFSKKMGAGKSKTLDDFVRSLEFEITYIEPGTAFVTVDGAQFEIVQLPGHSAGHIGFITPDNVFCPGDALISENRLPYSKLPYYENMGEAIATFDILKEIKCDKCIIAHNDAIDGSELGKAAEANKAKELGIEQMIIDNFVPDDSEDLDTHDLNEAAKIADLLHISTKGEDRMWINNSVRDRIRYLRSLGKLR
ncbi:MAG: MBL fold metallo-hydrolase [Lachnospiraceae bacterium]|nr:MBL fold metallo-hydrolase [Lachnospiraceae bacterium]